VGETSEPVAEAPGPVADQWARFDRWSSNLFLLLAVLTLVVLLAVLGLGGAASLPGLAIALTIAIGVAGGALLVGTSLALDRHAGWARTAASWMLWILVVTGVLDVLVALTRNTVTIPLAAIAAAVALRRRPGPLPALEAPGRRTALLVSLAFLATTLGGEAPAWLRTAPQSPLAVDQDALQLGIGLVCSGDPTATPVRVEIVGSWTWTGRDLVPAGEDGVGIGWTSTGEEDGDALFTLDATSATDDGYLVPGGSGPAGGVVARELDDPADGILTVWAVYAHLDRWFVRQEVGCRW
jgi:hypothetical protein